jgi:hypothetical protein
VSVAPRTALALPALFLSACVAAAPAARQPAPPASASSPASPAGPVSPAAAYHPPGECASVARGLDEVAGVTGAGVADLRSTTPEPQIAAVMHRIEALSTSMEKLRDGLSNPALAVEANRLTMAAAYLLHEVAELDGLRLKKGPGELEPFERTVDAGLRQLELAARSARALCEDHRPPEPSAAWKAAFGAAFQALVEPMRPCLRDEVQRFPERHVGRVALRIHVGPDGRVTLAGPTDLSPFSPYSGELVHCLVRVIDRTTFPRPDGEAIVDVPLGE